ncbi:MAG: DUF1501 domain-containing protein, partial [Pirellulaceae bacterium]|nr:DUF1501 domain-containing protein [Pirellulaceae bacterium]
MSIDTNPKRQRGIISPANETPSLAHRVSESTPRFPCGLMRREFVWQMGAGFAGLALSSLLEESGFFARHASAAESASKDSKNPLAPRPPHFATKAKACIFLIMNGGPSQVDTFDYKPALEKYAGKPLPPDKKYINSGGRKVGFLT